MGVRRCVFSLLELSPEMVAFAEDNICGNSASVLGNSVSLLFDIVSPICVRRSMVLNLVGNGFLALVSEFSIATMFHGT